MKIQDTPDYLIFADESKTGELIDFPSVLRGWGITIDQTQSKPPLEWMNGAFNRIDKNMLYLLQQGVPEWSDSVLYPVNAIIKYKGILYTAITQNDNAIPSTNTTKWTKLLQDGTLTQKGVVQLSSDIDSDDETKAATLKAVKEVNGLVGAISDKFVVADTECRVYSQDKKYYILVRNDGVSGCYNTNTNAFAWSFDANGSLVTGDISKQFYQSLSGNGYVKLPGGTVIQWGTAFYYASDAATGTTQSFYTAFPNSCLCMVSSDSESGVNMTSSAAFSKTQFKCWGRSGAGASFANTTLFYMAIGY